MANVAVSFHIAEVRSAAARVQRGSSSAGGALLRLAPAALLRRRRGGPPSASSPRSPGCRRSSTISGRTAADSHARVTNAERQPWLPINDCVSGSSNAPPTPSPSCTIPVARPRSRTNHLDTGTVAISAPPPGAVQPLAPRASSTPNSMPAVCARDRISRPATATTPATSTGTRGPRRSSQRPITIPLSPPAHRRAVCAQPIICRDRPSSSLIGITNSPKLSVPLA